MALSPSVSPLGTTQYDPSASAQPLSYLGLCFLNHRWSNMSLPVDSTLLATATITSYRHSNGRRFASMTVHANEKGPAQKYMYTLQGQTYCHSTVAPIPAVAVVQRTQQFHFQIGSHARIYMVDQEDGTTIQMFTNLDASLHMHLLLARTGDLVRVREKPENLQFWTTVHFQYFYWQDNRPHFPTDPKKNPKLRYIKMSIVHEHDTKVRNAYQDVLDDDFYNAVSWNLLPAGLPNKMYQHGPRQTYKFYFRGDTPDGQECYIEDVYEGLFYLFMYSKATQETHCGAHMAADSGMNGWAWVRINFDYSASTSETLGLLVCTDEENIIQDRVITKAIGRDGNLLSEEFEHGTDNLLVEPDELFLHKRLTEQYPDRNSFIKLRTNSYHYSEYLYPYKLYIEWAEFKTLNTLLDNFITRSRCDPAAPSALPEMFLWQVFRQLVDGCHLMGVEGLNQTLGPNNMRVNGQRYIHADLKPANILITDFLSGYPYPAFPIPVLADFGYFYHIPHDTCDSIIGTPGFQAPEQLGPTYPANASRVDVFVIGVILWSLTRNRIWGLQQLHDALPGQSRRACDDLANRLRDDDATNNYDNMYSRGLEDLITHCLQYDMVDRPTIADLKPLVEHRYWNWSRNHGDMMQQDYTKLASWDLLPLEEQDFMIGTELKRRESEEGRSQTYLDYGDNDEVRYGLDNSNDSNGYDDNYVHNSGGGLYRSDGVQTGGVLGQDVWGGRRLRVYGTDST